MHLQVDDDSSYADIKTAYRGLAMTCHPDIAGDNGHNICILLKCVPYSRALVYTFCNISYPTFTRGPTCLRNTRDSSHRPYVQKR